MKKGYLEKCWNCVHPKEEEEEEEEAREDFEILGYNWIEREGNGQHGMDRKGGTETIIKFRHRKM